MYPTGPNVPPVRPNETRPGTPFNVPFHWKKIPPPGGDFIGDCTNTRDPVAIMLDDQVWTYDTPPLIFINPTLIEEFYQDDNSFAKLFSCLPEETADSKPWVTSAPDPKQKGPERKLKSKKKSHSDTAKLDKIEVPIMLYLPHYIFSKIWSVRVPSRQMISA